jgi:hypothetical protein
MCRWSPLKTASGSSSVETNCPSEGQQQTEITKYSNYKAVGFPVEIINSLCIFLLSSASPGHASRAFYIFFNVSADLYTVSVPFSGERFWLKMDGIVTWGEETKPQRKG